MSDGLAVILAELEVQVAANEIDPTVSDFDRGYCLGVLDILAKLGEMRALTVSCVDPDELRLKPER